MTGVDQDKHLWHGRDSAVSTVHKHVADQKGSVKGTLGMVQGRAMPAHLEARSRNELKRVPGVIFPCMGNILGVILFLRGPWSLGKDELLSEFCTALCTALCNAEDCRKRWHLRSLRSWRRVLHLYLSHNAQLVSHCHQRQNRWRRCLLSASWQLNNG